ncbi:MAG: aminodeoxychorismate synthase component I [Marinilabiliales bacterium]|nr:aminodeoxychorismate synthase component I [Marinilabiliales bacterium]
MSRFNLWEGMSIMNEWGTQKRPFLFIIDFAKEATVVVPLEQAAEEMIYYVVQDRIPVSYDKYLESFFIVQKEILLGNSFLVNLTFPTEIRTNLTLREIFESGQAPYRLLYKDQFTLFSPEPFIKIKDGQISCFPMKGTIDAGRPDASQRIDQDPKEMAEHATIVDLIRNDLSMVATNVTVERYRYQQEIMTQQGKLLQVSSEIQGILQRELQGKFGTVMDRLLPAGSICGAPKKSTLEIIRKAEKYQRGFYTGVFGIFDGLELESSVMIRFVERTEDGRLLYKSGGGITSQSDPELEYQELNNKIYLNVV